MKLRLQTFALLIIGIVSIQYSHSQYTHPTTFIQNEYVGACLVSTCAATYTDNGGGGNYSNSINNIYRVFCPNAAGNCMRVTFNSFNTESGYDWLNVKNGPTQNSVNFTTGPANISGEIMGTPATPFSYTSSDASGCLTFRFRSDFSVTRPGWTATLACVPCAGGPNGTDNNDCMNLTPICSSASINSASLGPGIVAEGCTGSSCPAGGENHTNWYSFTAQTTGTFNMMLTPNVGTGDYDFAIYGPNVTCGALGTPIRCTDSGSTGTTGLTGTAFDNIEDVTGDKYLATMNITAGDSYIVVIDEWSPNSAGGYSLAFNGTASLDCTILPVELSEFGAEYVPDEDIVDLFWTTESERENDYFLVERSLDGIDYKAIGTVKGQSTTQMETNYYAMDSDPSIGVNYYRLKQFDTNGDHTYSEVKSVNLLDDHYDILSVVPNPTTGISQLSFNCYEKGESVITIYDGSGKIVQSIVLGCKAGANHFNIDLSSQDDGIYMITLNTNYKSYSHRIMKQ
tara:strand:+ start:591 stop:2126 length:1536 start_codon:yes stop_codon:yes gene_type:complete